MTGKYPGTVKKRGTDTSGRPILMSDGLWDWHRGFQLAIGPSFRSRTYVTQGACMALAGGGASDSGGYHDWNGALDYSLKYLSWPERVEWAVIARDMGGLAWPRDEAHGGMEIHGHVAFPWDERPIDSGIFDQRDEYVAGGDGLLGGAPDYIPRPSPLILTPPKGTLMSDVIAELRQVIKEEVGKAVLSTPVPVTGGDSIPLSKQIQQIRFIVDRTREFARSSADTKKLAGEIASQLGPAAGLSVTDVETAVRNVFADLSD